MVSRRVTTPAGRSAELDRRLFKTRGNLFLPFDQMKAG